MIQNPLELHLASGLIVLDGLPRMVRVPASLLALDALSYVRWSRDSDLAYAEIYADLDNPDFEGDIEPPTLIETAQYVALAAELRTRVSAAELILHRGGWVDEAQVSPLVRSRCLLEPIAVVDESAAALYAARLLEQDLGGADRGRLEWSLAEDARGWRLDLAPRLASLVRHAGPYVGARCVDRLEAR